LVTFVALVPFMPELNDIGWLDGKRQRDSADIVPARQHAGEPARDTGDEVADETMNTLIDSPSLCAPQPHFAGLRHFRNTPDLDVRIGIALR
jgi:hypothetical protein